MLNLLWTSVIMLKLWTRGGHLLNIHLAKLGQDTQQQRDAAPADGDPGKWSIRRTTIPVISRVHMWFAACVHICESTGHAKPHHGVSLA